ncbi:magnesium transporter [Oceanotoga sp. DSM 15011]|uniref:Magnesium transporter MgtE n=1 Tax=Oceanotoga teriensis TaxID=515440 RepID=A0AA45C8S2_9BACT|nr:MULTISPECIES: magnesium transporter [Oceanotoga]MDN5342047.1 magnesium transporter [Oceanotoga sp.]MDO7975483.1 magnesium transporter [Oceanotoga teriensis]PWJ96229.1 Mg2+ transporter MgtE [Oceanotoga teriensis]UYP00013.1 magnesium transporter [Oceanotoga sp. DSM 15011]
MKIEMTVDIKKLIDLKQFKVLKELISEQSVPYIVEILEELEAEEKIVVFRLLPKDIAAVVFTELEIDDQKKLLALFKEEKLKEIIINMEPDDRVEIFEELPANVVKNLLNYLSPQERDQTLILLNYPQDSAGRIMTPDFFDLKEDLTVSEALKNIRTYGNEKETIYTLFIINHNRKLEGVIELKDLIFADDDKLIKDIMNKEFVYVKAYENEEEVAKIMKDYDLLALPVTDSEKRLIGIITIDDIVDIIEDSVTEDIQKMAGMGVTDTSYLHTSTWKLIKSRVIWLIMLLLLESTAAFIIDGYSHVLQKVTILAAFIPTINAMGGNAGSQMSAIIIRSIALGELEFKDMKRVFFKELLIGSIMGVILSIVMGFRAFVNTQNPMIILSLSISLIIVVIVSNLLGAILPFIAKKLKLDPALISGPLISTLMDVISMTVYFSVALSLLKDFI